MSENNPPVKCADCGWEGLAKDCYTREGIPFTEDTEVVMKCPNCGSYNLIEAVPA